MLPLVLMDESNGNFWKGLEQFLHDSLLASGLISPEDVHLYRITHSVEETVDEVLRFYRVYHSMRYVDDCLVFRINHPISPEKLEQLNSEFSSILVKGWIEACDALPAESNEPEVAHLPRLKLHFNRRNFGRLRQFIDALNGP